MHILMISLDHDVLTKPEGDARRHEPCGQHDGTRQVRNAPIFGARTCTCYGLGSASLNLQTRPSQWDGSPAINSQPTYTWTEPTETIMVS
jgi:hypothetical protein